MTEGRLLYRICIYVTFSVYEFQIIACFDTSILVYVVV